MTESAEQALRRLRAEGQPARVRRSTERMSSVLSVRMPPRLLQDLTEAGAAEGVGPATLARQLIEEGLVLRSERPPLQLLAEVVRRLAARADDAVREHHGSQDRDTSGSRFSWLWESLAISAPAPGGGGCWWSARGPGACTAVSTQTAPDDDTGLTYSVKELAPEAA